MDSYFIIGCSADGLTFDGPLTRQVVEQRLTNDYYGAAKKFRVMKPAVDGFALQMEDNELFIIQGKAIVPKAKETVTRWEVSE